MVSQQIDHYSPQTVRRCAVLPIVVTIVEEELVARSDVLDGLEVDEPVPRERVAVLAAKAVVDVARPAAGLRRGPLRKTMRVWRAADFLFLLYPQTYK